MTDPRRAIPGLWECPKCGFLLVRRVIYALSGTHGAPDATTDVSTLCPNDAMPLEQEAEGMH